MNGLHKFRLKYLVTGVLIALLFFTQTWKTAANHTPGKYFYIALTISTDTLPPAKDTLPPKIPTPDSTLVLLKDSLSAIDTSGKKVAVDTFSLKISKDSLEAPVYYEAEDSVVVLVEEKMIVMYGKTKTNYTDIELTAPKVELDQ